MINLLETRGANILFLMATRHEYGDQLKKLFKPELIGVGPVEAGVNSATILQKLEGQNNLPDLVVCLGSAGSATLMQTQVYQVSHISYRDMDASALGFEKGCTPFLEMPAVIEMDIKIPDIPLATLSSGAKIINGEDYQEIGAQMADMETFAVMRACQHFGVPLVGLRGISDGDEEIKQIDDWTRYLDIVDENLANAVQIMLNAIQNGEIEL